MTRLRDRAPVARRRGVRTGALLVAGLVLPLLGALVPAGAPMLPFLGAHAAGADACAGCPAPTLQALMGSGGFDLEFRYGVSDHVLITPHECEVTPQGEPTVSPGLGWLVLRGTGEVWNCPHSSSMDTVTVTASETDSKDWSISTEVSLGGEILGIGVSTKIVAAVRKSATIQMVTTVSKQIRPAHCHRVTWAGFFEVREHHAIMPIVSRQRYGWWTKNIMTGDTVHRTGSVWVECGSGEAHLDARAPIAGYFHLTRKPCADPECQTFAPQDLGFFPSLPDDLEPPPKPADPAHPEDESDPPDEGGDGASEDGASEDGASEGGASEDGGVEEDEPVGEEPAGEVGDEAPGSGDN